MEEKRTTHEGKKREEPGFIRETIQFVLIALAIALPIRFFVAQPFVVNGLSMFPTFNNSDYLIVDQLTYRFNEPERGDVIVFHNPGDYSQFYIKRIIGLPLETVKIEGAKVTIINSEHPDGILLTEPYTGSERGGSEEKTLEKDEYFVLGDNRGASSDSRVWGPLKKKLITGRALIRLWPISTIDTLPGKADPETGSVR